MRQPSKEQIAALRQQYPRGARVMLDEMEDAQAPLPGTLGTVIGVDNIGSVMVHCDNGGSLSVLLGVDHCHVVEVPNGRK